MIIPSQRPHILCPKCRAEGRTTDCINEIGRHVRLTTEDRIADMDILVRFAVPVPLDPDEDPQELAGRLLEAWLEDPQLLLAALTERMQDEDYSLTVRPVDVAAD